MATLAIISGISAAWIAAGVGAAALPVAAHLLSRRGGPTVVFPAVRFVRLAAAEQASRDRPRDLMLLLLRVLIIALIALAFDRPVWSSSGNPTKTAGEDVVVVLDASASMTRVERGRTLFEIARDRALEDLSGAASEGSHLGLVMARLSPEALLPRLADAPGALETRLAGQSSTLEHADMRAALALAAALPGADPADGTVRARRVIVYSDMQATQWADIEAPEGVTLEIRAVGADAPTRNLAVGGIEVSPPRPIAGQEAMVSARIVNYSDAPARPLVTCTTATGVDGAQREFSISPTIAPGATSTVSFPIVFGEPGPARVRVGLLDASFTHDDAAYLVTDVRHARRLALVTEAPAGDRAGGAYYLEAALAPGSGAGFEVVRIAPVAATPEMLAQFDGAIIAQGGALSDAALEALAGFVESGGGLLWVIDSQGAHEAAARFGDGGGAMPSRVRGRFTVLAGGARMSLGSGAFDAPALRAFEGPAGRALMDASFDAFSPAEIEPGSRGVELMRFADGGVFLAWGLHGAGRIISLHADIAPAHASLSKGPMFPVLMHELMRFILPASGGRPPAEIGEPVAARVEAGAELREPVTDGAGRPVRVTRGGADFEPVLTGAPASEPGFVSFTDAGGAVVANGAAVLSPIESDLRPLDEEALTDLTRAPGADAVLLGSAAPGAGVTRRVIELWPWVFAAAVVLLMTESLVAGWTRRVRAGGDA